jgi:1-aminocyclopropane-1-carboxylate deaminase/D-cysteine desulfhydrase-like pyridoxal-dependent ACC family enzyme
VWDGALAPGYGQIGDRSLGAIRMMASAEGLFLDPVYTAKSFAAVPSLVESGAIPQASKVCFVHTGGLAALYAYEDQISKLLDHANG